MQAGSSIVAASSYGNKDKSSTPLGIASRDQVIAAATASVVELKQIPVKHARVTSTKNDPTVAVVPRNFVNANSASKGSSSSYTQYLSRKESLK